MMWIKEMSHRSKKSLRGLAFNFTSPSLTQMWLWVGISQEIAGGMVILPFTERWCCYQLFNNRKWLMMWWKLWSRINKTWKGTVWSVWSSEEEVCLCTRLFPEVVFLLVWSEYGAKGAEFWKWLKKKTVKEDMKYCWKTSLGDRLLPNAALQEGGGKSQEGSSGLDIAHKWKGISWRAAFDSGPILLSFLLPNPSWVILLEEGLQS